MATLPLAEPVAPLLSVEEYLRTVYEPECEYIDGVLEERNVGEYEHSRMQMLIGFLLMQHEKEWGIHLLSEMRTRVSATRYRVPDITVLRADAPRERITTHPPLIAIEILSPEDRMSRMQTRIDDFLAMGVENIWIIDPGQRTAWTADASGLHVPENQVLSVAGTPIRLSLSELLREFRKNEC
jgi:Uma2 family endonuclease